MKKLTSDVHLRHAQTEDVPLLAHMNKCLIEDEGHDNPMGIMELQDRMQGFLSKGYSCYLVISAGRVAGYILVKTSSNPAYLRHFYIERHSRRLGIGTEAFNRLLSLLNTDVIDVEVLHDNQPGMAFWRKMGFTKRYIGLRFENSKNHV